MSSEKKNILWIDKVKVIACILVVLGHLFQSLDTAGIMSQSGLYLWFNTTIYYFHVSLFFICSGYLHQMKSQGTSLKIWGATVCKKAVTIGIPYVVFSTATWVLKTAFSGSVNHQSEGLLTTLFQDPTSPYWYLYALFFLFLITPPFSGKAGALTGLAVAVVMKAVSIAADSHIEVYALSTVLANELWFVLGMVMCRFDLPTVLSRGNWRNIGIGCGGCFLLLSVAFSVCQIENGIVQVSMGILGCAATLLMILNASQTESPLHKRLAPYTMSVFLMHTIFAAGLRILLMKMGIHQFLPHAVLGTAVSFAGPILAENIMKRIKLDIFLYPGKYIRF